MGDRVIFQVFSAALIGLSGLDQGPCQWIKRVMSTHMERYLDDWILAMGSHRTNKVNEIHNKKLKYKFSIEP